MKEGRRRWGKGGKSRDYGGRGRGSGAWEICRKVEVDGGE